MQFISRNILVGAFVVLAVLGAFTTWLIVQSAGMQSLANDVSSIDRIATADALEMTRSGQVKLIATCCCAPSIEIEVPLLDALSVKPCVEKQLLDIQCNKEPSSDVRTDAHPDYRLRDGDPRETLRYAVVFNNQMLNYMEETNFGRCF